MAELKVYTIKETAELLKVTERTIYSYVTAGKLKATKMGKYWRVTEDNIRAFLQQDTPAVTAKKAKD